MGLAFRFASKDVKAVVAEADGLIFDDRNDKLKVNEELLQGLYERESEPYGNAAFIQNRNINWPDGITSNGYSLCKNQIHIVYEDAPFMANIELDYLQVKLTWSDGDIWTRALSKKQKERVFFKSIAHLKSDSYFLTYGWKLIPEKVACKFVEYCSILLQTFRNWSEGESSVVSQLISDFLIDLDNPKTRHAIDAAVANIETRNRINRSTYTRDSSHSKAWRLDYEEKNRVKRICNFAKRTFCSGRTCPGRNGCTIIGERYCGHPGDDDGSIDQISFCTKCFVMRGRSYRGPR